MNIFWWMCLSILLLSIFVNVHPAFMVFAYFYLIIVTFEIDSVFKKMFNQLFGYKNKKKEKEKHEDFSIIKIEKDYYDIRYTFPVSVRVAKREDGCWYIVMYRNGKWYFDNSSKSNFKDTVLRHAKYILTSQIGILSNKEENDTVTKKVEYNFSKFTKQQAADILGLTLPVDRGTVQARSLQLLKVLHPDKGGSNYLAKQINLAKDILLG